MALFLHELKRNKLSLIIWTLAVAYMLGIALVIYPEMKEQLSDMGDMFSNMGAFSDAFGMDSLNFGEFVGYFGTECGNVLGLGGAFFAAITGINALYIEENRNTAEFLLSHPISRTKIVFTKLLSVISQITVFNAVNLAVSYLAILIIGESLPFKTGGLIFLSFYICQLVIAFLCFCISAFLRNGGIGIAIGLGLGFYIINIFANITKAVKFLKYFTPFSFCEASSIISNSEISLKYLLPSLVLAIFGIVIAFIKYTKKDIA